MILTAVMSLIIKILDLMGLFLYTLGLDVSGIAIGVAKIVSVPLYAGSYLLTLAPYTFSVMYSWFFIYFTTIVTMITIGAVTSFIPRFRQPVG